MPLSKNKKIIIGVVAVVAIAGIITASYFARRTDAAEVQTAKVEKKGLLESKVTANGTVRPVQYINLTSEVNGRVMEVFVKEGDQVRKGKALLRVDPTQLNASASIQEAGLRASQADVQNQLVALTAQENSINTARAALNTAQADFDRAMVDRNNAEIELKRVTDLLEAGIQSKSAYDTAKARFDSSTASVNAAKARVEQAQVQIKDAEIRVNQVKANIDASKARVAQQQASLRQAVDQQAKTTQYASIDGVIVGPLIQVGTFATANFQSTPLMVIADMSLINVEVWVDETDYKNVRVGQKAKIKVDALGDRELEADIVEIAASAVGRTQAGSLTNNTNSSASAEAKDFKVTLRLQNLSKEVSDTLRPGMSATSVISTDRRESIIAVPLQALVEREDPALKNAKPEEKKDRKPQKGVFLIEGTKAKFAVVETGITGENDIEIKTGLREGQEIITGPYRQLRTLKDDSAVKREDKSKKKDDKADTK
jgi:HlyD family secretion protein